MCGAAEARLSDSPLRDGCASWTVHSPSLPCMMPVSSSRLPSSVLTGSPGHVIVQLNPPTPLALASTAWTESRRMAMSTGMSIRRAGRHMMSATECICNVVSMCLCGPRVYVPYENDYISLSIFPEVAVWVLVKYGINLDIGVVPCGQSTAKIVKGGVENYRLHFRKT